MRVIAGAAKGRRLTAPAGAGTRPMTDRAREALLSSLGAVVRDAAVLDLYAGSGSLGLEALSRGAIGAVFVERDRSAVAALRRNVAAVGLGGEVVARSVADYLAGAVGPFDLVFVDPPYAASLASVTAVLEALVPAVAPGAVVILHRRAGEAAPPVPAGYTAGAPRRYGDSVLWRIEEVAG
jgi:16S rRNA (guanine966-N2)-methyltransferase